MDDVARGKREKITKKSKKATKKRWKFSYPATLCPSRDGFIKHAFFVRRDEVTSSGRFSCVWSIENHVMVLKWVQTDEETVQFQITNRYELWNCCELDRYVRLEVSPSELKTARDLGIVTLDSDCLAAFQKHFSG